MTETLGSAARPDMADARLCDLDFTVVDVETTGWSPDEAGITEVGAVLLRRGQVVAEFSSLVNPGMPVPASITELTGISDQMIAVAPPAAAVLPGLLAFAKGSVLAAHNAPFDLGFLTAACAAAGLGWPGFEVLDTVRLARQLMITPDEVPDCKLRTLADFFGSPVQPSHRALADARATATVLGQLLGRLGDHGVYTLGELSVWLADREAEAAAAQAEAAAAQAEAAARARAAARRAWPLRLLRLLRRSRQLGQLGQLRGPGMRALLALPARRSDMVSRVTGQSPVPGADREAASGHRHRPDQGRDPAHP